MERWKAWRGKSEDFSEATGKGLRSEALNLGISDGLWRRISKSGRPGQRNWQRGRKPGEDRLPGIPAPHAGGCLGKVDGQHQRDHACPRGHAAGGRAPGAASRGPSSFTPMPPRPTRGSGRPGRGPSACWPLRPASRGRGYGVRLTQACLKPGPGPEDPHHFPVHRDLYGRGPAPL